MPRQIDLTVKPSWDDYVTWLRHKFDIDALAKGKAYFEGASLSLREQVRTSGIWAGLLAELAEADSEYRITYGADLLLGPMGEFVPKEWDRFLAKTFRLNVGGNGEWPEAPAGGWVLPPEWFGVIKDVVRTMVVVKYMDGVQYLKLRLEAYAARRGLTCDAGFENTELGYYAGHVVVTMPMSVPRDDWSSMEVAVPVEIQISTQLQEGIRQLLHRYYEAQQLGTLATDPPWQWDYRGDPFAVNYLGHILHYVEGQVVRLREETQ